MKDRILMREPVVLDYLLEDKVTVERVKAIREEESIGFLEAKKRLVKETLISYLNVYAEDKGEAAYNVLRYLLESDIRIL